MGQEIHSLSILSPHHNYNKSKIFTVKLRLWETEGKSWGRDTIYKLCYVKIQDFPKKKFM